MANGSHREGPAAADRVREAGAKHERAVQRALDEYDRNLPAYRDREESEITVNKQGVHVRSAFPRIARIALGIGLAFLFVCIGVAVVLWARR